jgi:hypothetical protein
MPNINQILPFATGAAANVVSPQIYAALTALQQGFQSGTVASNQFNTVLRQTSFVAAMIGQFTADYGPNSVTDDGNIPNFEANFVAALKEMFVGIPDCQDGGVANAIAINPSPAYTKYAVPMSFLIDVFATNQLIGASGATTISVNGMAPKPLKSTLLNPLNAGDLTAGGKILVSYDGVQFQLLSNIGNNPYPNMVVHYGRDVSVTPNQIIVATDQTIAAYSTPLWIGVYIANTNTGATQININNLGLTPVVRGAGSPVQANDLKSGFIAWLCYDGVECQLLNPLAIGSTGGGNPADWNDILGQLRPYWLALNSKSILSPPVSPYPGDAYLIPSGATGAWSGQGGKLCQWTGSAWVYRNYPEGSLIGMSDTNRFFNNNGTSWVEVQVPTLGRLAYISGCFG